MSQRGILESDVGDGGAVRGDRDLRIDRLLEDAGDTDQGRFGVFDQGEFDVEIPAEMSGDARVVRVWQRTARMDAAGVNPRDNKVDDYERRILIWLNREKVPVPRQLL